MNARSIYVSVSGHPVTDRRGAERVIHYKTGRNKGKVYPYASTRQINRDRMKAAVIRTRDAHDRAVASYIREAGAYIARRKLGALNAV